MRPVEHRTKKGIAVFGIKYNITANAEVLEPIVIVVLSTATVYVSTPEAHVNGIQKKKKITARRVYHGAQEARFFLCSAVVCWDDVVAVTRFFGTATPWADGCDAICRGQCCDDFPLLSAGRFGGPRGLYRFNSLSILDIF